MSVVQPHKTIGAFARASDPKQTIIDTVGDIDSIKVMQNDVLVATYIRPEKTSGGIIRPESALEEDIYQGKVGLVLKLGPAAFNDEERFGTTYPRLHDWCVYRVGDAWDITVKQVPCRVIRDTNIRLVVNDPEEIF